MYWSSYHASCRRWVATGMPLAAALWLAPQPARAVDGCVVLLCIAGPWQSIPECVPDVRAALRDVARGRPWPTCRMSDSGSRASVGWAHAPGNCPPQYVIQEWGPEGPVQRCRYSGVIDIVNDSQPWGRLWWTAGGEDSVTEYLPYAKSQLGTWIDPRFDDDLATWLATPRPPLEPPWSGTGGS